MMMNLKIVFSESGIPAVVVGRPQSVFDSVSVDIEQGHLSCYGEINFSWNKENMLYQLPFDFFL